MGCLHGLLRMFTHIVNTIWLVTFEGLKFCGLENYDIMGSYFHSLPTLLVIT